MNRIILVTLGKIPRGRIQSPAPVRPSMEFSEQTLKAHICLTMQNLDDLKHLGKDHFFKHPFLGDFKLQAAIRFLGIHTKHHLNIIRDIINSNDKLKQKLD